jgi:hypothetical protein
MIAAAFRCFGSGWRVSGGCVVFEGKCMEKGAKDFQAAAAKVQAEIGIGHAFSLAIRFIFAYSEKAVSRPRAASAGLPGKACNPNCGL